MNTRKLSRITAVALGLALATTMASAQELNSGAQTIALNANLAESLTLSLSASAVNFTLAAGTAANPGSTNITATTTWVLKPGRTAVGVYAYFANAAAALTDGAGDNIPSADFQISNNAGPFTALTTTVPFGGANAGLMLSNTKILGNNRSGSHTDLMNFNINLTTLPSLPAATYTGTLTIQAQAL
jgi:hypothetical protein